MVIYAGLGKTYPRGLAGRGKVFAYLRISENGSSRPTRDEVFAIFQRKQLTIAVAFPDFEYNFAPSPL